MTPTDAGSPLDSPTVGRPQLSAAVAGLERSLSDLLYGVGMDLLAASRLVERRHVEAFLPQSERLGAAFNQITVLHGQLAALDEMAGGRLHGTGPATFPAPDVAVTDRIAAFQAGRALEKTHQRPWTEPTDVADEPEAPA